MCWAVGGAFSGMGRPPVCSSLVFIFEVYTLLAWVTLNWFLAQLDGALTSSVDPTWGVGDVLSSEGHSMVGQTHSCSEVRPGGWWGPMRNWITQGPGWGVDGGRGFFSMTLRDPHGWLAC